MISDKYDVIIGLEIHAELDTKSKMFCSCDNNAEGKEPNEVVCPICLGHPGTLPVPNKQAIDWTILLGLALGGKINKLSKFDRKNYFYPDIPKGYQISQYDLPFVYEAVLTVDDRDVAITRIHLEEDTGKSSHPQGRDYTLIDFNRAGTPLIEMVTEPVISSAEEARKFCQKYQQILRYLKISRADMEKGQMRCEANVSIQKKGCWSYTGSGRIEAVGDYKLNPKVELKNINSFKAVERAVNYEISRQIDRLENGEKLVQETRGWNDDRGESFHQRYKEEAAEYRYFPDPDIPPIRISDEDLNKMRCYIPELPDKKKKRFAQQYGISLEIAEILVADHDLSNYAEEVFSELIEWINSDGGNWETEEKKLVKMTCNWLTSELFKHLKENNQTVKDLKISPENFAELITYVYEGKINSSAGQRILEEMYKNGADPSNVIKDLGLEQLSDEKEIEKFVKEVILANPDQVEKYRAGKEALLQYFVGKVMSATGGKVNPQVAADILKKALKDS